MTDTPPRAVTVDLDDTLFPQQDWLDGAWGAVAERASVLGLPGPALRTALHDVAAEGSDRGRIVDRALDRVVDRAAGDRDLVPDLVAAFTAHAPARLEPYPGVAVALRELARRLPVVCITDGNPRIQQAKIDALGLRDALTAVVVSDALEADGRTGRVLRKPHPAPFRRALHLLGLAAADVVHVGDRPGKDVAGAAAVGMRCVRVLTGEYATAPDEPPAWRRVGTFAEAAGLLLAAVEGTTGAVPEVVTPAS